MSGHSKKLLAVLVGVFVASTTPGTVGDLLIGLVVAGSVVVAVRAVRRMKRSSAWRWIIAGGLMLTLGPVFEISPDISWFPWSVGDLLAFGGYTAFIFGFERVLRARTQSAQIPVLMDATLLVSWLVLLSYIFIEGRMQGGTEPMAALAIYSYAPFTALLILQVVRLLLGSPARSRSFAALSLGAGCAGLAEFLLLLDAVGGSQFRSFAMASASFGILFLAVAVADPSAMELEQLAPGDFHSFRGVRAGLLVGSNAALIVVALSHSGNEVVVAGGLAVLAALTSARMVLLVNERDKWVLHEKRVQKLVSQLMDASDAEEVLDLGVLALNEFLHRQAIVELGFYTGQGDRWRELDSDNQLGAIRVSEVFGLAVSERSTQKAELLLGRRYGTELAVPVVANGDEAIVLGVETLPVLDATKVAQIESIATSTSLALRALDVRERSHQERSDRRFRALVQDTNDIVVLVSPETRIIEMVSPTIERLLGYHESACLGQSPFQHMRAEDRVKVEAELASQPGTAELAPTDVRLQHADGQFHWFSVSVRDLSGEEEISGHLYSFSDINDRKMAELQVLSSEERYRSLVKNASDVFAIIDRESRITFVSPNVNRLLGFGPNDLIGTLVRGLLTEQGEQTINEALERLDDVIGSTLELQLRTQDGRVREAEVKFSAPGLGDEEYILLTVHDVTEQRRLEEALRTQAFTDSLTGLLNRASIYPRLQQMLQSMENGSAVGVLHLNVNEFSAINESVGFGAGDQILVEIATRLRGTLRAEDVLARVGGDEFIVLSAAPTVLELSRFGQRLADLFEQPFFVGDRFISLSATVGVATTDDRHTNATTLLENGGLAVRAATRRLGEGIITFDDSMRHEAAERFELAADLLDAIDEGQFSVVYQPVFDIRSNRVSSLEALLRWKHPERGHVSPGVFIPLAERTGAIVELGRWVMRQACQQLSDWHANLAGGTQLGMAVNVSARQLEVDGESEVLLGIIAETGVNPLALTIELTESTMIEDTDWLRTQLDYFRRIGVRIAVDDFGTGAAGIGHLRDVHFDVLKIDKSYIDEISLSGDAASLVAGVIELAHGMNAKLVAEGIEMPAQSGILKDLGCDYGQGFFLGRPMDPRSLEEWFAQGREGAVASLILAEAAW